MDEPQDATAQIQALRGVTWEWRPDAPTGARDQPGIGVIAQEVEAVFPELVVTGDDGIKRVNYLGLFAPLIEAVKELDDRVRTLEAHLGNTEPSQIA